MFDSIPTVGVVSDPVWKYTEVIRGMGEQKVENLYLIGSNSYGGPH